MLCNKSDMALKETIGMTMQKQLDNSNLNLSKISPYQHHKRTLFSNMSLNIAQMKTYWGSQTRNKAVFSPREDHVLSFSWDLI